MWDGLSAGGIVGSLAPDWTGKATPLVTNNVAKGEIALADGTESDATIHRIVGRTIENEEDCTDKELRLANNFAVKGMKVNGVAVESDDAATVEGKTATEAELNKAALEALGYAYGTTDQAPWKETSALPVLYFENSLKAFTLSSTQLTLKPNDECELVANSYGASALNADVESTNDEVVEITSTDTDEESVIIALKAKKEGKATINVTLDNVTVSCEVTVAVLNGINETVADNNALAIVPGNGVVKAEGALSMAAFALDGRNVARANGELLKTSELGKGVFVVVANFKDGKKATAKVIVK